MQKLYLDVCTLCRPFDDQSMMRIRLETDAYYLILRAIQNKKYRMIVSPVHYREIECIKEDSERVELLSLLKKFGVQPKLRLYECRIRAEQLYLLKFGIADAAHIAFAEQSSDFLITCDDRMRKKIQ